MVKYRRLYSPDATYFFTVALSDRKANYLTKYIKELGCAMRRVKKLYPYEVIALVVLPDHLHTMWELPNEDVNYSQRWRCIKTLFAKNLKKSGVNIEINRYQENILWQRRFWEHVIRNDKDYARHVDYIHYNPVKHRLVRNVKDWPYSSFHRYVREGIIPANWSYCNDDLDVEWVT